MGLPTILNTRKLNPQPAFYSRMDLTFVRYNVLGDWEIGRWEIACYVYVCWEITCRKLGDGRWEITCYRELGDGRLGDSLH
jgi:hypothetical protein